MRLATPAGLSALSTNTHLLVGKETEPIGLVGRPKNILRQRKSRRPVDTLSLDLYFKPSAITITIPVSPVKNFQCQIFTICYCVSRRFPRIFALLDIDDFLSPTTISYLHKIN